jgi:hypothetical protein
MVAKRKARDAARATPTDHCSGRAEMRKTIPPEEIGRMISGVEAAEMILRQARQAKMLTKDEEHRAVTNIAKLRQLRGRRDGDT